jgi:hypothetical protein
VLPMGSSWAQEAESVAVLVPIRRDVKALVHRVALLEGELEEARRAQEVAEQKVRDLSSSSAEGSRRRVTSKAGRREQSEDLFLLCNRGAELCFTILGLSPARTPLTVKMRAATLRHTRWSRSS